MGVAGMIIDSREWGNDPLANYHNNNHPSNPQQPIHSLRLAVRKNMAFPSLFGEDLPLQITSISLS